MSAGCSSDFLLTKGSIKDERRQSVELNASQALTELLVEEVIVVGRPHSIRFRLEVEREGS